MTKPITPSWVSRRAWGSTFDTIENNFEALEFFASYKASSGSISSPASHLDFTLPEADSRISFEGLKFDTADTLRLQVSSDGVTFDSTSGDYAWTSNTRTIDGSAPTYSDGNGASMFICDVPASTDPLGLDVKLGIVRGTYLDFGRVMTISHPPDDPSLTGSELVTRSSFGAVSRGPSIIAVRLFPANPVHNFAAGARRCTAEEGSPPDA